MSNKGYKLYVCQHCNNKTLMEIKYVYKKMFGNCINGDNGFEIYTTLFCPSCEEINIIKAYWDMTCGEVEQSDEIYGNAVVEEEFVYPQEVKSKLGIPKNIDEEYKKAIKSKSIGKSYCLFGLRKTLEMICNEQGVTGRDLHSQLKKMEENNLLPKTLSDASIIAKKFGNMGVHEETVDINDSELFNIIKLIEYIMDYIYVLPKEIEKLEKKINKNTENKICKN